MTMNGDLDLSVSMDEQPSGVDESNDVNSTGVKAHRPPFKQPDFNPEEWELVEEDDCLMELKGITKKNFLQTFNKDRVKLTGLFDPDGKSFLQLDDMILIGEPSETFGTNIVFEVLEDEDPSDDEDTFKNTTGEDKKAKKLKYLTKTDKTLTMYRGLLLNKTSKSENKKE